MKIDCAFPGGNIVVDKVEGDNVFLRPDLRDTQSWWFYWNFKARSAAGRKVTFTFSGGKGPIGVRGPAISTDEGCSWRWMGNPTSDYFSFSHHFVTDCAWFSFTIPYTEMHLRKFLGEHGISWANLCLSRQGRPVELIRHGKGMTLLVTARHHACEAMASYVMEGMLVANKQFELIAIPFVDKDGVEAGDPGKYRAPLDHGRGYLDDCAYPETKAIRDLFRDHIAGRQWIWIDLHCPWIRGPHNECVYIVGSSNEKNRIEQERFASILESSQSGKLGFRASDTVPFGTAWNVPGNFAKGLSPMKWAEGRQGWKFVAAIEIAYANANGNEVNIETARGFGCDLIKAIELYCQ